MQVYVVVTNGEVNGEVEGVYTSYEKAKEKFEEVKQNWLDYASKEIDIWEDDDICSITDFISDEYFEIKIVRNILE